MGEERNSSGGGTAMIVVAILGGILLVLVCGGVLVVGAAALFYVRAEPMFVEDRMVAPVQSSIEVKEEVNQALEPTKVDVKDLSEPEIRKEKVEGPALPELKNPGLEIPPPSAALEEKKE
jgi:hypothetical protein